MIRTGHILLLAVTLVAVQGMLEHPDYWLKKGFDITDGKLKDFSDYQVELSTVCNELNLNKSGTPYDYNGVAMSGYMSVKKGGSALAFLFFGKEGASK